MRRASQARRQQHVLDCYRRVRWPKTPSHVGGDADESRPRRRHNNLNHAREIEEMGPAGYMHVVRGRFLRSVAGMQTGNDYFPTRRVLPAIVGHARRVLDTAKGYPWPHKNRAIARLDKALTWCALANRALLRHSYHTARTVPQGPLSDLRPGIPPGGMKACSFSVVHAQNFLAQTRDWQSCY